MGYTCVIIWNKTQIDEHKTVMESSPDRVLALPPVDRQTDNQEKHGGIFEQRPFI